ncbi:IucA/IucC family protein [Actinomadura sp. 9N407]|uniref:IucA/IucC family protein n=1 Tax=Actinomadura sp. 9N407 TaxID=3375154 RepID=UPI003788E970
MNEGTLAARVLDALVREDYGGLRRFVDGDVLALPDGPRVRLAGDARLAGDDQPSRAGMHPGFLSNLVVDPSQGLRLDDVLAVVRRLADPRDDVAAFERECHEALATALRHEAAQPGVVQRLARVPEELRRGPGTYYETLAAYTDHPVHPTSRCRIGLNEKELKSYAPEFAPTFQMRWAAVPRERVTVGGVRPDWWPDDEDLFPVHPLTVPDVEDVRLVPEPYLTVAPTLSMRTVAVDGLTHLKVPLTTSTLGLRNRRTIVPRTLPDGALAERLLRHVLEQEPGLPILLADEQTYGHAGSPLLGYLVRRFPPETARAHVVPVAGLLAEAPDGRCVIEQWDVPTLFGAYLDALFTWNVALFRYGIALEAHQQNVSLVVGDDGLKLLLKDYDGTLVHSDGAFSDPAFGGGARFQDARMVTRDREALARVFVTITLHLCAAAPAFGLAGRGLLPLPTGLAMVRERLDAALGPQDTFLRSRTLDAGALPAKAMVTAGTLVDKARTGSADINKHYGPPGPNYLHQPRDDRDDTCC